MEDLLECAPTSPYVYNLRSPDNQVNGGRINQVERINTTDDSRETIVDFTGDILEQINALGIGRDAQGRGRYLYFTTHIIGGTGPGGQPVESDRRYVYQYDLLTEELTSAMTCSWL